MENFKGFFLARGAFSAFGPPFVMHLVFNCTEKENSRLPRSFPFGPGEEEGLSFQGCNL